MSHQPDVPAHVDYPHEPGRLLDCCACEHGPCVCDPQQHAPCVSIHCVQRDDDPNDECEGAPA